jgi:hypothetical protein
MGGLMQVLPVLVSDDTHNMRTTHTKRLGFFLAIC